MLGSVRFSGLSDAVRLVLAVVLLQAAPPAIAETTDADTAAPQVSLESLSDYLRNLSSGWAQFTQINSDGTISTGTLLVNRPSYARIEYDPPAAALLIADSRRVAIFDLKSNTEPLIYPISATPFYYLLNEEIDFSDPEKVTGHRIGHSSSEIALPVQQADGSIRLLFHHDPIRIAGWSFIDRFGQQIRMQLGEFGTDIVFQPEIFDIDDEIRRRRSR